MKNLLINRPIVSLIAPPLKIFLILFCLAGEDLYNDRARGGDGARLSHTLKSLHVPYWISWM